MNAGIRRPWAALPSTSITTGRIITQHSSTDRHHAEPEAADVDAPQGNAEGPRQFGPGGSQPHRADRDDRERQADAYAHQVTQQRQREKGRHDGEQPAQEDCAEKRGLQHRMQLAEGGRQQTVPRHSEGDAGLAVAVDEQDRPQAHQRSQLDQSGEHGMAHPVHGDGDGVRNAELPVGHHARQDRRDDNVEDRADAQRPQDFDRKVPLRRAQRRPQARHMDRRPSARPRRYQPRAPSVRVAPLDATNAFAAGDMFCFRQAKASSTSSPKSRPNDLATPTQTSHLTRRFPRATVGSSSP